MKKTNRKPQASDMMANKNVKSIELYEKANKARWYIKDINNRLNEIRENKRNTNNSVYCQMDMTVSAIAKKYYEARGFKVNIYRVNSAIEIFW